MTHSGRERGRRRALGRGLDALMPAAAGTGLTEIDVARIEPNPRQPRQRFDRGELEELAGSIRLHGVVQPLVVTAAGDDRYRIVVGERRWRAAQLANLERVPVVIREASDRQTLELALVENVQRADLNPLEEAQAYQRLIQESGMSQTAVAEAVGKSRVAVANTLRLLLLPEAVKRAIVEGRITEGHGRALLGLREKQMQLATLERVLREELTVRQTEELVRRLTEPAQRRVRAQPTPDLAVLEDELRRSLGTRVTVRQGTRGGRIVIEYHSDDEFQGLYERLTRGVP